MKKAILPLAVLFGCATLAFLAIVVWPVSVGVYTGTESISGAMIDLQPRAIELEGISIQAQPTSGTCGITAVAVASNFINHTDYAPGDLIKKLGITKEGASDSDMLDWLQRELPGRKITHQSNGTDEAMIRDIHASLMKNNPVVISFAAPNPYNIPYYDSHASIVYGLDLGNETITIANVYGYIEDISLVEFLNRMSFTERDKFPFWHRFIFKIFKPVPNRYYRVD